MGVKHLSHRVPLALSLVYFASLGASACGNDLQAIEADRCGNMVLETGEDCEHLSAAREDGFTCGASDSAAACRWQCLPDDPTAMPCPEGFACGADGICRRASGELFAPQFHPIPAGLWLGSGDFDGDHYDDIAWAHGTYARVDFMEAGAPVDSAEVTQQQLGWPSIGDANQDDRADLLLPTVDGLSVFRGGEERELLATTFASTRFALKEPFIVAVDAVPDVVLQPAGPPQTYSGEEVIAFVTGGVGLLLPDNVLPPDPLSGDIGNLSGTPVIGEFDETGDPALYPAASPTPEELILGFVGEDHATVYRPSIDFTLGYDQPRLNLLAKPSTSLNTSGFPLVRLLAAVHANPPVGGGPSSAVRCGPGFAAADEHLDVALLTRTSQDGEEQPTYSIEIAYGIGDGRFHSDPCVLAQVPTTIPPDNRSASSPLFSDCQQAALAIGHFDADGLLDIVTARGIWQSWLIAAVDTIPTPSLCVPASPHIVPSDDTTRWREVVVADMNQDGAMDIAAARELDGLDLYLGSSGGALTHSPRPGVGVARTLAVGDYDGDNSADVAFLQEAEGTDSISIVFGETLASPGEVVNVGALEGITRLLAFDRPSSGGRLADNAEELGVQVDDGDVVNVATLFGRADRQLQAPFVLTYPNAGGIDVMVAVAAAVGKLHGDGQSQVALVGLQALDTATLSFDFNAAAANTAGDLTFDIVPNFEPLQIDGKAGAISLEVFPGHDEFDKMVVASSPSGDRPMVEIKVAELVDAATRSKSAVRVAAGTITLNGVIMAGAGAEDVATTPPQNAIRSSEICDVGGDAGPVLLLNGRRPQPCASEGSAALDIGVSSLLLVDSASITAALAGSNTSIEDGAAFNVPAGWRMTGFACLNADGDAAQEVAMLLVSAPTSCEDSTIAPAAQLWLLDFDAAGNPKPATPWWQDKDKALGFPDSVEIGLLDAQAIAALLPRGLARGDYNGDGVDDLAAGNSEVTVIWLAKPNIL